ncbi:hypothetical protein OBPA_00110 [Polaribacter sp. OB-PA-B3]
MYITFNLLLLIVITDLYLYKEMYLSARKIFSENLKTKAQIKLFFFKNGSDVRSNFEFIRFLGVKKYNQNKFNKNL